MGRPRVRPLVDVNCAHCGAPLRRTIKDYKADQEHFCNKEHYWLHKQGKPGNQRWHTSTLLDEYKRVMVLVGHPPTWAELKEHSVIYPSVYQKRFGTLDHIVQMIAPDYDPNLPAVPWSIDELSPADGGWLSGFCAGEGCFRVTMNTRTTLPQFACVFHIQLRADDTGALLEMKRLWRLDTPIRVWNREGSRLENDKVGDGAVLSIRDIPTLASRIVPTFTMYPLRAKKQADFEMFRRGVDILMAKRATGRRHATFTDEERAELEQLYWAMRDIKQYKASYEQILETYPVIRVGKETRATYSA